MKIPISIILILLCSLTYCQSEKSFYETNINKAFNVEIKDGIINIKHADSVIVKVFVTESKYKLYVNAFNQFKDSTGNYITYIHFINPDLINYEVDLTFKFDKPIIGSTLAFKSGAGMLSSTFTPDLKVWAETGKISSADGFFAAIKSVEKIQISITGVYGILKK